MNAETTLELRVSTSKERRKLRLRHFIPVVAFGVLVLTFAWALNHNPREIPLVLVGMPVPQFSLAPVKERALGLSSSDLIGDVSLVKVFASWCVACREEHPLLMQLKRAGLVVHGLDYKDGPDDASKWLDTFGDPYSRTGADRNGRGAIDWGVYGVPETFVITKDGRIAHKHIGPLTAEGLESTILPLMRRLARQ